STARWRIAVGSVSGAAAGRAAGAGVVFVLARLGGAADFRAGFGAVAFGLDVPAGFGVDVLDGFDAADFPASFGVGLPDGFDAPDRWVGFRDGFDAADVPAAFDRGDCRADFAPAGFCADFAPADF